MGTFFYIYTKKRFVMAKKSEKILEESPEPRVVLGLDVSTATIGISLVLIDDDGDVKPIEVTHLRLKIPTKIKGAAALFMKNDMFIEKLKEYAEKYIIDTVVIEEPLTSSNNTNTVSTLLKFNGIVSWSVYRVLGVIPEYISSYDARKYGMPQLMAIRKYDKKGNEYPYQKIKSAIKKNELVLFGDYSFDVAKKYVIWNFISERFPDIDWIEDNKGDLKKENFDASDSLICILGYLNHRKYGDEPIEIIACSENDMNANGHAYKSFNYSFRFCGEVYNKKIVLEQISGK